MSREEISEHVKRKLYAESMGRCMNPACRKELFNPKGDIIEKAHIVPYCDTADNSFENLVVLCPNCHTNFDKNKLYDEEEVRGWKKIRSEELNSVFCKKFVSFEDLKQQVYPLLFQNKTIYENYYLERQKELWDMFEGQLLANNRELKMLLENNLGLIQDHSMKAYSNLACVHTFLMHIDEFESTRDKEEKIRQVIFPNEINSMFGVSPVKGYILPSTESLEAFIAEMQSQNKFVEIVLGIEEPYIVLDENGKLNKILLNDTPKLRQLYFDNNCFKSAKVRLESLIFALKYISSRKIKFEYRYPNNLRNIMIKGINMIFIYEYCLSKATLMEMSPEEDSVIVNLHNWNGVGCISNDAYDISADMGVKLLRMDEFYGYINKLRNIR